MNEYLNNYKHVSKLIDSNLWRNAVIIEDESGRILNSNEFNKLYNLNKFEHLKYIKKVCNYIKKSVLNPRKAVKRLVSMIKFTLKQK